LDPKTPVFHSGIVTLTGVPLRCEQDLVSLRRHTRAAAEQFGLGDRSVWSFCAAAYEAARTVGVDAGGAGAEIAVTASGDLQVSIRVPTMSATERQRVERSITALRTSVPRVSLKDAGDSLLVTLATALPSEPAVAVRLQPEKVMVDPAASALTGSEVIEENVRLRRALMELQAELAETNRGVVALYAEIETQAERLRQTEEQMRTRAEELAAANRAKEDFLATLSHELRTPLNAMLGWARLLRMGKLDAPAQSRALETIERNAHVQEELIADILDVSRIVTGKLRMDLRPLELEPVVDAALDALQPAAAAKGVHLSCALARTGMVQGDPDRLQQVVWNLLANAIKFTPPGGSVCVSSAREVASVVITVSDTGEGIATELLPYVFDRFTQGDGSVTRLHGGLGLGLSIVRHIVELHGGQVKAHSDGPGQGAAFSVRLPLRT
jgi:signal transduction histidine kinase